MAALPAKFEKTLIRLRYGHARKPSSEALGMPQLEKYASLFLGFLFRGGPQGNAIGVVAPLGHFIGVI